MQIGWGDVAGDGQAKRIDQQMAFAPLDVFMSVIAADGADSSTVFTLWLSMMPALGSGWRPTRSRSARCRAA
jgi:hypothetical protein